MPLALSFAATVACPISAMNAEHEELIHTPFSIESIQLVEERLYVAALHWKFTTMTNYLPMELDYMDIAGQAHKHGLGREGAPGHQ